MPTTINSSTFLDAYAAGQFTDQQYQTVVDATAMGSNTAAVAAAEAVITSLFQYGPTAASQTPVASDQLITVGLMLGRVAPQSQVDDLLGGNWAQRQEALAAFPDQTALWATYGADPT